MKRRTLDLIFSAGGIAVALLLVVLGFVFKANADFAETYVKDQLSEQKISFAAAEFPSDEEKASSCLVEYAGTALDSGKKAECYANDYIKLHLQGIGGGETYATLGAIQTKAKTTLADATKVGASNIDALKADYDKVTGQRETMFKGETLRGLLRRPLGELAIRKKYGVTIVSIKPPGGEFQHADQATILQPGELILLAGKPASLDAFVIDAE